MLIFSQKGFNREKIVEESKLLSWKVLIYLFNYLVGWKSLNFLGRGVGKFFARRVLFATNVVHIMTIMSRGHFSLQGGFLGIGLLCIF